MKTTKANRFLDPKRLLMLLLVSIVTSVSFSAPENSTKGTDSGLVDFTDFRKALEASNDVKATLIGDSIFGQLEKKYRNVAGFSALKSKLNAAEFLAKQMVSQLNKASGKQTLLLANELFKKEREDEDDEKRPLSVAPAKSFYETSKGLFSKPVRIANLDDKERSFLAQYYDLKLRNLIGEIVKAGQALTIAKPSFEGTYEYVLVLPLLHASNEKFVSTDILPRWMQNPEHLNICSDACLLHFGFPFHAMIITKQSAQRGNRPFSELEFYKSAAKKCGVSHSHIAADCLLKAIDHVPDNDGDAKAALHFDIVKVWLDSGSYALAAGRARTIFENFPNHKNSGKAFWLYFYALSRSNNTDEILAYIDNAIGDRRCDAYKAKLMYVKWWALRRKRDETARVAALEYELLKQYGNDSMVAPILLSRATDLLACQDYTGAYDSLAQLVEKFPSTKAAAQAKRMLVKLKAAKGLQ